MILPSHGGNASFSDQGHLIGRPELVVEVSASTASYDLNLKLDLYRANRASEYLVWRVFDRAIDWFVLRDDRYERLQPGPDSILRSHALPGLWLDAAALLEGNSELVANAVKCGLATPEHAAFVDRLRKAAASRPE
jgi:hypothetical protein